MKTLCLLCCLLMAGYLHTILAQTNYQQIASNRMIQKHHKPERIQKIAQIDPLRLQVLWNYFSESFSYNASETGLSINELLNIQHFDITEFEHLRQADQQVQLTYRGSILITLKSGNELNALLQGYDLHSLVNELPERPFPTWTGTAFSEEDFQSYKEKVWDWANDYPSEYQELTSDTSRLHVSFKELKQMHDAKRIQLLTEYNYLIID